MHDADTTPGAENYEHRDAHLKPILFTGIVLTVVTLVAFLVGYIIMNGFEARKSPTEYEPSPLRAEYQPWKANVRLQINPPTELDLVEAEFEGRATSYDTVSEQPEVYRIPIEKAMDIVAEYGLPDIQPIPPADAGGTKTP